MRFTLLTLAFLAVPLAARANGYDTGVQASAQAGAVYAAPQQALVPSYPAQEAAPVQRQVVEREITLPAEYEDVIVQRQERRLVQPERTVIQRDVVDYVPVRSTVAYSAPLRSFSTGCNLGAARSFSNIGYGAQAQAFAPLRQNVVVQRAPLFRAPRLFAPRGQRIKSKAKTVIRN